MPQTIKERRRKLAQARNLVDQMIQINEICSATERTMLARGLSIGEIKQTLDKILDAGGPFGWIENMRQADFRADGVPDIPFSQDTLSDRLGNLLMSSVEAVEPIEWEYSDVPAPTVEDLSTFRFSRDQEDLHFNFGVNIGTVQLPSALNPDGPVTYELSRALPPGITHPPGSTVIGGTPNTEFDRTLFSWSAVDSTGAIIRVSFYITVGDLLPDPFPFQSVTNVIVNRPYLATATITGLGGPAPISVEANSIVEWTLRIDDDLVELTDSTTIDNLQKVTLEIISSRQNETRYSATVIIGGVSSAFSVTTGPRDAIPIPFHFSPVTNAETDTDITSNSAQITGINAIIPVIPASGTSVIIYDEHGDILRDTSEITEIENFQSIAIRVRTSGAHSTPTLVSVSVGAVDVEFSVTTKVRNSEPDADFSDITGANPGEVIRTNTIKIDGLTEPTFVAFSGAIDFSVTTVPAIVLIAWDENGQRVEGERAINNGYTIQIRFTAAPGEGSFLRIMMSFNNVHESTFLVTNKTEADVYPIQ